MPHMSMTEFAAYVRKVMRHLPEPLVPHVANLIVDVEDDVDPATRKMMDLDEDETLLGLYVPFPIDQSNLEWSDKADRLIIYRRPHLESFPERRRLLIEIRRTVIHELAHHFGYSEEDLEPFEAKANPFPDMLDEHP